ncbi:C40 family peptidase [Nakamurella leprariae]|uniref:C40 family peptidase n=1 Tax=Nakamurella leprariae TaxID=2803911 RepID=A0A938YCY9_9ACTN|nr:NlpC/P60 family protein [Nakamurella leprariae]MBM9466177.1 C40 family peptidase [Nakamurella leprariae]
MRPLGTLLIAVLAAGVALVGVPAAAVPPPPDNPSDQEIADSQSEAQSAAAEVGRIDGLVTRTEGDIERLQQNLEIKAELANKARVDLDVAEADAQAAQSAADQAQRDAQQAGSDIDDARAAAQRFAAASFRQGSVLGSVSAFLDAQSATDLLQRDQLLQQVSSKQLNVLDQLERTRTQKSNLDSVARASLDAATEARLRADEARVAADQARAEASAAFDDGQAQLASLQAQLAQQQDDYRAALDHAATLQGQREEYNQWLAAKQAEEEAARKAAEEAARKAAEEEAARQAAEAARIAAEQAAAAEAARVAAEQAAARAAAQAAADAAAEQARVSAARAAQAEQAASAAARTRSETYYASCDDARAAGRGPIARGEDGYRAALDPNSNGVACEGQAQAAAPALTSNETGAGSSPPSSAGSQSRGQRVVDAALRWVGTQYAWGGGNAKGPTLGIRDGGVADQYGDYAKVGFDCSGLALYAWAQVGVSLPHYSAYQYSGQPKVSKSNLQPGDLVFFAYNTSDPTTIHHVAIYMGNNQMVEAPNSGSYVRVVPLRTSGYIGATRPGS